MTDVIRFEATVYKVATLADYGIRLTLDLPEDAIAQAAQLMECKRQGIPLQFEAKVDNTQLRKRSKDDRSEPRPKNGKVRTG